EAAERRRRAHRRVRVDREHTRLDRTRDSQRAAAVLGPDRAREAVVGVVREPDRLVLAGKRDEGGDRAEDLVTRDPVIGPGFDERGRVPEALAVGRIAAEERIAVDEARDRLAV